MNAKSCQTLRDPVDCSPPGSSVHGILQARILEWVAIFSSRASSPPAHRTLLSSPCLLRLPHCRRLINRWATGKTPFTRQCFANLQFPGSSEVILGGKGRQERPSPHTSMVSIAFVFTPGSQIIFHVKINFSVVQKRLKIASEYGAGLHLSHRQLLRTFFWGLLTGDSSP